MKTSWHAESGRFLCRWSDPLDGDQEKPPVVLEASAEVYESYLPPMPDFAAHSLLGSGEWMVPWDHRWSVQRSSTV